MTSARPQQQAVVRADKSSVAKATGLAVEQVDPFVVMFGDKPYINKDGRRFKMDLRFGAGGYTVSVGPPSLDEYAFLTRMMGIKEGTPCVIMKAVIMVDGEKKSEDYGYAIPTNCPGGQVQFDKESLHIAITRATNRAMGMLVAGGFSDPSMTYEGDMSAPAEPSLHTNPSTGHAGYVPSTGSAQASFLNECKRLKKLIVAQYGNETPYYSVLGKYGAAKSHDHSLCSDADMMKHVLDDMALVLPVAVRMETPPEPSIATPAPAPIVDGEVVDEPPIDIDHVEYWLHMAEEKDLDPANEIIFAVLDVISKHKAMEPKRGTLTLGEHLTNKVKELVTNSNSSEAIGTLRKSLTVIDNYNAS